MQPTSNEKHFEKLAGLSATDVENFGSLSWFVLYVQSRHEKFVSTLLKTKGIATCLPLTVRVRQWCDRRQHVQEPIFPGYVFCQFDPRVRAPILGTPGVVQILGAGKQALPLGDEEINALMTLERAKAAVEESPFITKGQIVVIESGPLRGLTGVVSECKNGLRVVISVALLQRSVAVEVNQAQIRSIKLAPGSRLTECHS
jgi:transcription antitermination factor NusG